MADLNKNKKFNPFSEKSKELIRIMETQSILRCDVAHLKYNAKIAY